MTVADEVPIPPDGEREYEDLPTADGPHRFEITVEDGANETGHVEADWWDGTEVMMVTRSTEEIDFTHATAARPTNCT